MNKNCGVSAIPEFFTWIDADCHQTLRVVIQGQDFNARS
jgi:hypothetical protein